MSSWGKGTKYGSGFQLWINVFSSINIKIISYIFIANGPSYITQNIYYLGFKIISILIQKKTLIHILNLDPHLFPQASGKIGSYAFKNNKINEENII